MAVVERPPGSAKPKVALLGEAKWGTRSGPQHYARLARARDLLAARGYDTTDCRLACFSGKEVAERLRTDADSILVTLDDLYR